ncbi:hypothetical protein Ptr902_01134 [Pyrenophora tritici-repentis]|uniref:Uncharacterized protein n=2 Tax=Pyrenophora tritici-repentis TaxID=45151 RepID=A0A834S7X7_9PLEO|nr:uncharacterized protein PTRG_01425 [Pyrenophora tritici-repentis Pt-1C-BFP]KAF7577618.1 hypothetical protein PtrM4_018580 [Pyrenophora tritici-repentis]EDU40863.1 hypothetical protein PTRG_01425 [Pyrenophora tritici-repentis Pt-1C-BFP]KAI1513550.1 hypothetical protein Ptr86124_007452 [Pyrenophora tritici-repentis]KAI1674326.1 hypothetical protein L13192_01073 [Pyrenophora tritici-repentis]KAI1688560.1 hypothetical protein KJE20_01737 [Pyrenophora tritici-repentis]
MTCKQPNIPPPLQIPPSRARRQFALRLAQRKAQLESTREVEEDPDDPSAPKTQEQEEREGHQRFARMFEGIEDSSDDDSLHSIEGMGDDEDSIVGRIEVEGQEVGSRSPQKFGSPEKDRAGGGGVERKDSGDSEQSVVV